MWGLDAWTGLDVCVDRFEEMYFVDFIFGSVSRFVTLYFSKFLMQALE